MDGNIVAVIVVVVIVAFILSRSKGKTKRNVNDPVNGGGGENLPPKKDA